jgi:hypothetical protein
MTTIELTAAEVHLLEDALQCYISAFGHDEAGILSDANRLLRRLTDAAQVRTDQPVDPSV